MKVYLKRNKKMFIFIILFSVLTACTGVFVQFLKGSVLDSALNLSINETLLYAVLLFALISVEILFFWLYCKTSNNFVVKCMKALKLDFFSSLLKKDYVGFRNKSEAEYISTYTKSMAVLEQKWFSTLPVFFEILSRIIFVSIGLFILDWRLAIITLFLLSTPIYIPKLIKNKLVKAQNKAVASTEKNIEYFTEWIQAFETIKNFNIVSKIQKMFQGSMQKAVYDDLANRNLNTISRIIMMCISYFSYFIVIAFSAYLVLDGTFSAGDFFIAIGMIDQLSYPLISLSGLVQNIISVKDIAGNVISFSAELPEDDTNNKENKDIETFDEYILFEKIYFSYPDSSEILLNNFNLNLPKGSKTLITGASGRGKSTLLNLLFAYYTPNQGCIKIDGKDLNDINIYDLISIVRQEPHMFADTLRNNLTLYDDIQDDVLIDMLKRVNLVKIANIDDLNKKIELGGKNLSGGEKKRIALARTLLRETSILLFDEPLANLDEANVDSIEDLILSIEDKTIIVVSHHFSANKLNAFDYHIDLDKIFIS
ncbi:MAG: ABC transporter ATP-binding protein/permease [Lachnospiraceae bacterium]|nr:ABC transporter ATP-binding protein/permease [Lachnospiraceae bacterium]